MRQGRAQTRINLQPNPKFKVSNLEPPPPTILSAGSKKSRLCKRANSAICLGQRDTTSSRTQSHLTTLIRRAQLTHRPTSPAHSNRTKRIFANQVSCHRPRCYKNHLTLLNSNSRKTAKPKAHLTVNIQVSAQETSCQKLGFRRNSPCTIRGLSAI
jgi:hypothetical protein